MSTQTQTTTTAATPPPPPAADTKAAETGTSLITAPDAADKKTEGAAAGATEQKQTADTGGDKAKEEAAKKAAEDFELKLPDGVKAEKAFLDGFKAIAKENGLKGEGAQKFVDFYVKAQKEAEAKSEKAWAEQNEAWKKQVQDDKDIGGPKLKETIAHAKRFVAKFGTPALTKLLDDSGLGNHPDAVRLFAAAGKALAEDTVGGAGAPTNKKAPDDPASLYPNTKF